MWQWMEHEDHGGKAKFPVDALDEWKTRGWRECDAPPEPDVLHDVQLEPQKVMKRRAASDG